MSKQKYSDDYELVTTVDEKGREKKGTQYRGDYFEITLNQEDLLRFKRYCSGLLAAITVLHLSAGFIHNKGMYQFFVSLPYVIGFLSIFNLGQGIFHLPREVRSYRRDEIGRSFDRIRSASKTLFIILAIGLIGEIIYLIFFPWPENISVEFLYLGVETLAIFAAYLLIRIQQPIIVTKAE